MRRPRSIIAALALPALAAMPALAQRPDSGDAVGRELVTALLGPGEVWVERLPDGFPAGMLPPDARLLGGRMAPGFPDRVMVVAAVPEGMDSAMAAAGRWLLQAGWEHLKQIESPGGFQDEPSPMFQMMSVPVLYYSEFCRAGESMTLTAKFRKEGGSYLLWQYENRRTPTLCAQSHELKQMTSTENSPIPALYAPGAVRSSWYHRSIGEGSYRSMAELRTRMSAAALAARYADQLRRAGWTRAAPPAASGGGAVHTFHYRDSGGTEWSAVLIVAAVHGTDRREAEFWATPRPTTTRD